MGCFIQKEETEDQSTLFHSINQLQYPRANIHNLGGEISPQYNTSAEASSRNLSYQFSKNGSQFKSILESQFFSNNLEYREKDEMFLLRSKNGNYLIAKSTECFKNSK